MNSEPNAKLFELGNDEISLIKTKYGAFGEEHDFGKNNIYFKLPNPIGTTKWSYADDGGTIYYGLCYWKEGKEKFLVIERQMSGSHQFSDKTIEYYSKSKGLIKKENINPKTNKLGGLYFIQDSGFDSQMDIEDFPLSHSVKKDKSSETKEQQKNVESKKQNLTDKEKLNAEYFEKYGRSWDDYERMFKHLPAREIKKVKVYDYRVGRYKIVNVLWFPREEAINRQKHLDYKRGSIFK